jgi:DNA integrity scanning protein DisA with diadenylate cyclase activity/mannitol/fructose-specific phosphotransferase system IIA component (Ntr-type)
MVDLSRYLTPERVVFLQSGTKESSFRELVTAVHAGIPEVEADTILNAIWERENTVSSWIAPGIALPHARLPHLGRFVLSVGRSDQGIGYDALDGNPVHLIFLLLGDRDRPDEHILLLAEVARLLKVPGVQQMILAARSTQEIYDILTNPEEAQAQHPRVYTQRFSRSILQHAVSMAEDLGAKALMFDADALGDLMLVGRAAEFEKVIPVVHNRSKYGEDLDRFPQVLELPFSGLNRSGTVELSLLLAISRNFFRKGDRVVSVSGRPGSGVLDTITVFEVGTEFPLLLSGQTTFPLGDIEPQTLEKVLQITLELSQEGREGRPVGTLFVIGDYDRVIRHCRQMVINPFRGYSDEERSIMDPSLEETVKEFSTIDGAFIVRGDGILMAAGTYLRPEKSAIEVPAGLGARHTAAAAITSTTSAIAVALSQSTGNVSVFAGGKLAMVLQKPKY